MPMSDGETKEALDYIRKMEVFLESYKTHEFYELFKHMLSVLKRLSGDRSALVE
jgi:hypothetical protein